MPRLFRRGCPVAYTLLTPVVEWGKDTRNLFLEPLRRTWLEKQLVAIVE
jgi:hypothetical protein